jgi:hypothetical protein
VSLASSGDTDNAQWAGSLAEKQQTQQDRFAEKTAVSFRLCHCDGQNPIVDILTLQDDGSGDRASGEAIRP